MSANYTTQEMAFFTPDIVGVAWVILVYYIGFLVYRVYSIYKERQREKIKQVIDTLDPIEQPGFTSVGTPLVWPLPPPGRTIKK